MDNESEPSCTAQLFVICLSVQEYESYTLAGLSFC